MSEPARSSEPLVAAFREQYRDLAARIETVTASAEREALKREIIAYFKRVDAALVELGYVK